MAADRIKERTIEPHVPLPRLLIVDDEKDIVDICGMSLSDNFQIKGFSDSSEALDYFRTHSSQFDLVLTDIRMPKLNGFQLAKGIRSLRADIPILFMTAFNIYPSEYQIDYPSADERKFIDKPSGLLQLKETLIQAVTPNVSTRKG